MVRVRLHQTQIALDQIHRLLALPSEILNLKDSGKVVEASSKLKEAKDLVIQLGSLNENSKSNYLFSSSQNGSFDLNHSLQFIEQPLNIDGNNKAKLFWNKILEKFDDLDSGLVLEGKKRLRKSISEKKFETCKVWMQFFEKLGSIIDAENIYIEEKQSELLSVWNGIYNSDSSSTTSTEASNQIVLMGSLRLYFSKITDFYDSEIEFCEMAGINDPEELVLRPLISTSQNLEGSYSN
ncbi:hypothetical protein AYI68_g2332 [Smittium mucronatum]|uniref:Uncharacterized protein n=1 Tax=Smittium mucronatum TaxID=133383 RepID=A0A1R0H318_9FUNG|nr:hypothetical protein AYI68_g2332 [Smittium mucronatum]